MAGIGNFDVTAVLKANVSDFQRGMAQAQASLKSFTTQTGSTMQNVGSTMAGVGKGLTFGVTAPLLAVGAASVKTAMSFEKQMNRVKAISGATGNDFDKLRNQAIKLGADSVFSATEVAQAQEMMASAGFDTNQIYGAMPGVMDLAAVSGGDMALASEAVATAMNQFGLEASEATHVANVFAQAAADTNAETTDMAEALKYAGPIAGALGISMEETASAIGVMANAGIKGSQAGTTLRSAFTRLAKPTSKASDLMEEMGFSAFDAEGKMKPLETIIGDLQTGMAGMTDQQKQQAIATLFGQEAMSGMLALVNSSPGEFAKLTDALTNSTGAAEEMAGIMNSGLAGAMEQLKGAMESAGIAIGTALTPTIQTLAEHITSLVDKFNALSTEQQEQIVKWGAIATVMGPLVFIFGKLVSVVPTIISGFKLAGSTLSTLVSILTATGTSFSLLGNIIAILTGPIGVIIAAISGLIAILVWLYNTNDTVRNAINTAWTAIYTTIGTAVTAIVQFFTQLGERIYAFITQNQDLLNSATTIWNGIQNVISTVVNMLIPIVSNAWDMIKGMTEIVWNLIKTVIQVALEFILGTLETILHIMAGDWESAFNTMNQTGIAIWNAIKSGLSATWQAIKTNATTVFNNIKTIVMNVWNAIKTATVAKWNEIKSSINSTINNIKSVVNSGFNAIKSIVSNVMNSIKSAFSNALNNMKQSVSSAVNAIKNTFNLLRNIDLGTAGRAIMNSFLNGLKSAWGAVQNFVGGIGDWIKAHKGPISYDKRLLIPAGKAIMGGLNKGLQSEFTYLKSTVSDITGLITNGFDSELNGMNSKLNGMVNSAVTTDVRSTLDYSNKPAYINLSMGGQTYRAYVEDISSEQTKRTNLELGYL